MTSSSPNTLQCMNCQAEVNEEEASFFAKVFLCRTCSEGAKALHAQATMGIGNFVATLEESIRTVLTSSRYPFNAEQATELSPEDTLLFLLLTAKDKRDRDAQCRSDQTASSKSLKPPAATVGGSEHFSKPSAPA